MYQSCDRRGCVIRDICFAVAVVVILMTLHMMYELTEVVLNPSFGLRNTLT